MIYLLVGTLIGSLAIGVPVAFSLAIAGLVGLIFSKIPLTMMASTMFSSINQWALMAVPFFILSATILHRGGSIKYLIDVVDKFFGHIRGGLAVVATICCMLFAAMCGSSIATAAAIGGILIPQMWERGYERKFAMGVVATGAGIGILIPPSIPLIIYGYIAEESVGALFLGGIGPGVFEGLAIIAVILLLFRHKCPPPSPAHSWKQRIASLKKAIWALMTPVVILGGIYGGIFTPTEAAAVSAAYALFISCFVYKDLPLKDIPAVLSQAASTTAMIMLIVAAAMVFGVIVTSEQIPQKVAAFFAALEISPYMFLLMINIFYLIAGAFMEVTSILLITVPILLPAVKAVGIDPVHFGVVLAMNMDIAAITPPIGLNLFAISSIVKEPVSNVVKGVAPLMIADFGTLAATTYIPALSLFLPRLFGYTP